MRIRTTGQALPNLGFCFLLWAVTLVISTSPLRADSWTLPTVKTVLSQNGDWSATMTPGLRKEKTRISVRRRSTAGTNGGWERESVNSVSAVELYVSDQGALVTLGEWHQEGHDHSVVIYSDTGNVVIDQNLEDFLTASELERVGRSVSSRWWRYASEKPEIRGEAFFLTTSWGLSLRFDLRTGRVSREGRMFERFRSYCAGTRKARQAVIYVSRAWEEGETYTGRHCELRRSGGLCRVGGERFMYRHAKTKVVIDPKEFDLLLRAAGEMTEQIVADGVYEYDKSFIHLQIAFGDSVKMSDFGAPEGGDVYWLRYRPANLSSPSAKAWTKRLEDAVGMP